MTGAILVGTAEEEAHRDSRHFNPSGQRLRLGAVTLSASGGGCTASVELTLGGQRGIGTATGLFRGRGLAFLVAEATLQAITQILGDEYTFILEDLAEVPREGEGVIVGILSAAAGKPERFVGAARGPDFVHAVPKAILSALNRRLARQGDLLRGKTAVYTESTGCDSSFGTKIARTEAAFDAVARARWSEWEDLGGILTAGPAVASWSKDRLNCFVGGPDNHLWHKWWDGVGWSEWEDLGGLINGAPAAVSWGPHRIDCFARGLDNHMWHKWWDGVGWNEWEDLGGILTAGPAVASWSEDRLDCFVGGPDNHMWHKWWDGVGWSEWEDLGGLINGAPAAVSWGPHRIDCFARGLDNHMWHKWWDGVGWSEWEDLGGLIDGAPAAVSWGPHRIDCFARGLDNHMWHKRWD